MKKCTVAYFIFDFSYHDLSVVQDDTQKFSYDTRTKEFEPSDIIAYSTG
jgi:hypothetical protein